MNFEVLVLSAVPEGRVFGLDLQTLIGIGIQLFNACLLAFALAKILYRPVRKAMAKRTERIESQMIRAEEDMAKAEELKLQYEKKLQDIESERADILRDAREAAAHRDRQMLAETEKDVRALKERAAADIESERQRLREEVSVHILDVSLAMAGKFVTHAIDKDVQDRMFNETVAELEDSSWPN